MSPPRTQGRGNAVKNDYFCGRFLTHHATFYDKHFRIND